MRHILRLPIFYGLFFLICTAGFGCRSSTPPVSFYTLTPVSEAHLINTGQDALKGVPIGIGPVKFPKTLNRPQIITRPSPNRLELSEFHRWGGDLKQDFINVLGQNISSMTGSDQVATFPWPVSFKPVYIITLDIHQFDGAMGESVLLNVSWMMKKGLIGAEINRSIIKQPVSGNDYEALVSGYSQAIAELSREVSAAIKTVSKQASSGSQ
jgi:hypothetical protein